MISGPEKATRGPLKASGLGVQYIQVAQAGTPAADTSLSQKILLESASEKDRISEVNLGLDVRKPVLGGGGGGGVVNNTGTDQPAHLRSLISAFVNPVLESTISKLATSEISFF